MTQPRQQCEFCAYRDSAGTLTIHTTDQQRNHQTCWTCAREASSYYTARLGFRVTFASTKP